MQTMKYVSTETRYRQHNTYFERRLRKASKHRSCPLLATPTWKGQIFDCISDTVQFYTNTPNFRLTFQGSDTLEYSCAYCILEFEPLFPLASSIHQFRIHQVVPLSEAMLVQENKV